MPIPVGTRFHDEYDGQDVARLLAIPRRHRPWVNWLNGDLGALWRAWQWIGAPALEEAYNQIGDQAFVVGPIFSILMVGVATPLLEELTKAGAARLTRGYLHRALPALLFGACEFWGYFQTMLRAGVAPSVALAVRLPALVMHCATGWLPLPLAVVAHMAWNIVSPAVLPYVGIDAVRVARRLGFC